MHDVPGYEDLLPPVWLIYRPYDRAGSGPCTLHIARSETDLVHGTTIAILQTTTAVAEGTAGEKRAEWQLISRLKVGKETMMASQMMERMSNQATSGVPGQEGSVARMIEQQTKEIPSDWFLWGAGACVITSVMLQASGRQHTSLFVGQWVPTLLILGLYNKLVKVAGSDGDACCQ